MTILTSSGTAQPSGGHRSAAATAGAVVQGRAGVANSPPHPYETTAPSSGRRGAAGRPPAVPGGLHQEGRHGTAAGGALRGPVQGGGAAPEDLHSAGGREG